MNTTNLKNIRFKIFRCPICGPSVLIRFGLDSIGIRCIKCRGSGIHFSIVQAIKKEIKNISDIKVYELSAHGALFRFLKRQCMNLTFSEYFKGVQPGTHRNGILCQDVQKLTFKNESFDLCTSTEVFEHVTDDLAGFREVYRVLKPCGKFIFTVPLSKNELTVQRVTVIDNRFSYILPKVYHGEKLLGKRKVLCYRDYGRDILKKVLSVGFEDVIFFQPIDTEWWNLGREVIIAKK